MTCRAYYNENDRFAAAWLRELMAAGHIAAGEVDERDIREVQPDDLKGFTQHHFFAGIGVWSYALRGAGWPDSEPVWTGSCPCQSFSTAGKRLGTDDPRHLWPEWWRLIEECRPDVIFGEQVASKDALAWLDIVQTDLEGAGYAFAPFDLCAAGFGAPHLRQRLYFVADSGSRTSERDTGSVPREKTQGGRQGVTDGDLSQRHSDGGSVGGVADTELSGRGRRGSSETGLEPGTVERLCTLGELGNAECKGLQRHPGDGGDGNQPGRDGGEAAGPVAPPGFTNGFWGNAERIWCRDEKYRPVEPGTFPLAHGAPARVGRLRGYGNAINAEVAEGFIRAYREAGR